MTVIFNLLDGQNDIFSAAEETGATAINGLGGHDQITGGKGNDTINGGQGNDTVYGGANGSDLLMGEAGNDRLVATSSADGGRSTLMGGVGDDTYVVGAGQTFSIVEKAGEGFDTIRLGMRDHGHYYTMQDNVEQLFIDYVVATDQSIFDDYNPPSFVQGNALGNVIHADYASQIRIHGRGGNDTLYGGVGGDMLEGDQGHDKLVGGSGDDYLYGDDKKLPNEQGNDTLDGGEGADRMFGDGGNDLYYVDNAGDEVLEAAGMGTDSVITTLTTYTLGANVENLSYSGLGNFVGNGNALANQIVGGLGTDVLRGMEGADQLFGGLGHDQLYGGAGNDRVQGDSGNDNLLGDAGADTLLGGSGNDNLDGGSHNDVLEGGTGADTMAGSTGNDTLRGGDGEDVMLGGNGADDLHGGAGADSFRFTSRYDSPAGGTLDAIRDFQKGIDRIDLSGIDANQASDAAGNQAFGFSQSQPFFHGPGDLWLQVDGASTYVHADVNGDGAKDFSVFVEGVTGLTASDFIL